MKKSWFNPGLEKLIDADILKSAEKAKLTDTAVCQLQLCREIKKLAGAMQDEPAREAKEECDCEVMKCYHMPIGKWVDGVCPCSGHKPQNTDCWLECPLCHADLEGNTLIAHLKAGCQDKKQECPPKLCGCGSTCCAHGKQEEPEPSDLLDRMWSDLVLYRAEEKEFRKDVAEIMSGWTDGNSMRQAIKDFCKKYLPKGL